MEIHREVQPLPDMLVVLHIDHLLDRTQMEKADMVN
jgi:hypothetical protein